MQAETHLCKARHAYVSFRNPLDHEIDMEILWTSVVAANA